jgi:hypothetical protein
MIQRLIKLLLVFGPEIGCAIFGHDWVAICTVTVPHKIDKRGRVHVGKKEQYTCREVRCYRCGEKKPS